MKTFLLFLIFTLPLSAAIIVQDNLEIFIDGRNAGRLEGVLKNYPTRKDDIESAVDNRMMIVNDTDPRAAQRMYQSAEEQGCYIVPASKTAIDAAVAAKEAEEAAAQNP